MGAIWLVFRAEFRQRWRSWIALGLLVGLVGGAVLAAVVAGRRTASAFPRFVAAHGYDTAVYALQPEPGLAKFAEVESVTPTVGAINGKPTCRCTARASARSLPLSTNNFGIQEIAPSDLPHVVQLVSGRFPRRGDPWEVLASFTAQRDLGMGIGSVVHVPLFGPSQTVAIISTSGITPVGPTVDLRVVGIEASIGDFPTGSPSYSVFTSPAFARLVNPKILTGDAYYVRLRHGAADLARFSGDAGSLGGFVADLDTGSATVQSSLHPEAVGWWVLAIVAGVAGLAIAGQAVARQAIVSSDDFPAFAALGTRPRQLAAIGVARAAVVGVVGALVSVVLAGALSPLTPVGEARVADPSPGFSLDPLVLPLGALAVAVVVVGLGLWPAIRAARVSDAHVDLAPGRPSRVVAALASTGAPPAALIGVRHALERGRGRGAVPVGTALLGTVLALVALCGTAVFGASLSHLTATPDLYGDAYQVWFNGGGSAVKQGHLLSSLQHDPAVGRITLGVASQYQIDGLNVAGVAGTPVKGGKLLLTTIDGHMPDADGQVAMATTTMRQVGAHIGSVVRIAVPAASGGTRTAAFRVVGTTSFPPDFPGGGLGRGAVLTIGGLEDASCPAGPGRSACRAALEQSLNFVLLVGTVPGPAGRAAVARYVADYPGLAALPQTPAELVNFGETVNFPLILGVALAVFGSTTLVHLLVVSVTRRRREMGLLKALGFVPRQLGSAVCWQATTIAVVGTVVGVPLGIAAGHVVWRAFATNLGFVAVPFVTAWVIVALAVGAVVLANVFALGPALAAGRGSAGRLLRTE